MRVTATELIEDYGTLSHRALAEPITIVQDGRDRLVLLSREEYDRLRQRDRRAVLAEELSEREVAALEVAEVDARHAHLDDEARGWQP